MAQPSVVRKCLSAIASNYSKNEQWVEDNLKLWVGGLMAVTDKDLARGTETWCRTKNMAPNLARLRAIIEADPTTKTATVYNGCPACDQTGWREMAGHYENKNGEPAVLTCVAACDCQRIRQPDLARTYRAIASEGNALQRDQRCCFQTLLECGGRKAIIRSIFQQCNSLT